MPPPPATETIVTTQACERIYKSTGDTGRQESVIRVGAGASLFWLPQETILFDGGRLRRGLDVSLEADARFLGLETLVFGREAMGETVASAFFHDRWRIRGADGDLVHADDVRFDLRGAGETADARPSSAATAFSRRSSSSPRMTARAATCWSPAPARC